MSKTIKRYLFLEEGKSHLTVEADDAGFTVPKEIQILKTGEWDTPNHGKFTVTEADLDAYIKHFDDKVRAGVPIDLEHRKRGDEAYGWVEGLRKAGDGLWASVSWTKSGASLLADKAYKYFSPEFYPKGYTDPETGKSYDNVLIAGALTNRPLFKSLNPIVANDKSGNLDGDSNIIYADEGDQSVQLDQIRSKDISALTEGEQTFLSEHKAELSETEQTKFGLAEAKVEEPVVNEVAASDDVVKVSASEFNAMKAQLEALKVSAADGVSAKAELEKTKATNFVTEQVARGAIKADDLGSAVELLTSAAPKQREALESFMTKLPDHKLVVAGEIGSSDEGSANATNDLIKLASDLALEKKIPYDQALLEVSLSKPELVKAHDASRTKSDKGAE
jgi:hypothetical protein